LTFDPAAWAASHPGRRFRGADEAQIKALEDKLGAAMPPVYRGYLAAMGWEPGDAARGSDIRFGCLHLLTREMFDCARGAGATLPGDAIAVYAHQGYDYLFFRSSEAAANPDPPLWRFHEVRAAVTPGCPSISSYLERLLSIGDIVLE